jgi:hypothetical protein
MTDFIYKASYTYYYDFYYKPNATKSNFIIKVPGMGFSKWENCKTVKLSDVEFEQFLNFSADQWIELFTKSELRRKYLIFTEKVKRNRKTKSQKIVDYYNTYLAK